MSVAPHNVENSKEPFSNQIDKGKEALENAPQKHKMVGAERVFTFFTHGVIGFAFNYALSLFITCSLKGTDRSKQWVDSLGDKITKWRFGNKPTDEQRQDGHLRADSFLELGYMYISGWITSGMILPLEHYKQKLLPKIDKVLRKVTGKKAISDETYEAIANEVPKISFWKTLAGVIGGRLTGMAVIWGLDQTEKEVWGPVVTNAQLSIGEGVHNVVGPQKARSFMQAFGRQRNDIDDILADEGKTKEAFKDATRIVQKELMYTMVMAGLIYVGGKIKNMFGVKQKPEHKSSTAEHKTVIANNTHMGHNDAAEDRAHSKKWTQTTGRAEKRTVPHESHVEAAKHHADASMAI